jgi:hypothetical protein
MFLMNDWSIGLLLSLCFPALPRSLLMAEMYCSADFPFLDSSMLVELMFSFPVW